MIAPGKIESSTQSSRIAVESTPKYAVIPPQTPPILASVAERSKRR